MEPNALSRVAPEAREPGEDQFGYTGTAYQFSDEGLWCPWCGGSLTDDDGEPERGEYVTSEGERIEYPPDPRVSEDRSEHPPAPKPPAEEVAYHRDCYKTKKKELHKVMNRPLSDFGGDE